MSNNYDILKARVDEYIKNRDVIKAKYDAAIASLNNLATGNIARECPIKVGDIYHATIQSRWQGARIIFYKVAKLDIKLDGTVSVYGYKQKIDKTWGKRDNNFMFVTSVYQNFKVPDEYVKQD